MNGGDKIIIGSFSDSRGRLRSLVANPNSSRSSLRAKGTLLWIAFYAGMSALWYVLWRGDPRIAAENCAMENFQALCLIAGILLLMGAIHPAAGPAWKILFFGLTLFYFTILVLEMDTRKMNVPIWLVGLTNGTIRDVWLASCWIIAAGLFLRRRSGTLACFLSWLWTSAGELMICSGVFWAAALVAEKQFHVNFFAEELLECNAALLMAQSAWLTLRASRRSEAPPR